MHLPRRVGQLERTGVGAVVLDAIAKAGPDGMVCLTGVSSAGRRLTIDPGALNRELVLENLVVFGSVNANRRHYQAAAAALERQPADVKVVIDLPARAS